MQAERVWQASQHTLEHYRPTWSAVQPNISWHTPPAHVEGNSSSSGSSSVGRGQTTDSQRQQFSMEGKGSLPGRRTWRALFQTRSEAVRQLDNLGELLDRCADWQHMDEDSGTVHSMACGVWPSSIGVPELMAGAHLARLGLQRMACGVLPAMLPCSAPHCQRRHPLAMLPQSRRLPT